MLVCLTNFNFWKLGIMFKKDYKLMLNFSKTT